jgi:hypothetical protein
MTKVLSPGAPLPVPQSSDPKVLQQYLVRLAQSLRTNFETIAERTNDELLVRPDWVRLIAVDYTVLPSDRILLVYPPGGTATVVTLPLTADWDEPHAITVRCMTGLGASVDIVPTAPETTIPASPITLVLGEAVTLVPVWQEVVDRTPTVPGPVAGWVTTMHYV